MAQIIVGVADLKVSNSREDLLVTYALGSCLAVVVFDSRACVGGMLHFMLAESSMDPRKAELRPAMFADTGIPLLFKSCYKLGADKRRMTVKIIGGAAILDRENRFRIGHRNIAAARKIFWKNKVFIDGEDTGGNFDRTVRLDMSTGTTSVSNAGGYKKVL